MGRSGLCRFGSGASLSKELRSTVRTKNSDFQYTKPCTQCGMQRNGIFYA